MTTYAIKYKGKYLKFGSYCKATSTDNPVKSSLYSLKHLANNKLTDHERYWIDGVEVKVKDLKVAELTLKLVKEREL